MLFNYIKLALRNFQRHKTYSLISVMGLTIGLLSCIVVATVVLDQYSYDTHWAKSEDLYRIISKTKIGDELYSKRASSWGGLKSAMMDNFPEVETVSQIYRSGYQVKKTIGDDKAITFNALDADTLIWQLFDFKIYAGQPKTYTHGIANLVLSKQLKERLFPNEDAIGKKVFSISSFDEEPVELLVTGVIEYIPANTHLRSDALVLRKGRLEALSKKEYGSLVKNYVAFKPETNIRSFTQKLNSWYTDFIGDKARYSFEFQPISEVYLNSEFDDSLQIKGDAKVNGILIGVALLLLTIGCVNFINLSVAHSISKVKSVGVRKIIGSSRWQIVCQFLTESLLYFAISTVVALTLFQLLKPSLESYLAYPIEFSLLHHFKYVTAIVFLVFILTLIVGIYPAVLVSGFKSINSIKGQILGTKIGSQQRVQKLLVVTQFSIAIFVLVALFVVNAQYNYMMSRDIGYNASNLLTLSSVAWNGKAKVFQNEINKIDDVEISSMLNWQPTKGSGGMSRMVEDPFNPNQKINVFYMVGDVNMVETLQFSLKEGRLFDLSKSADVKKNQSYILFDDVYQPDHQSSLITAYTKRVLDVQSLDQMISNAETVPVGVLENFHTKSLREDFVPVIIKAESDFEHSGMLIRLKEGYSAEALNKINEVWKQIFPNKYLSIDWVDDLVAKQYAKEKKLYGFFMFFGMLCLALAAMGVYGLVAQSTQQRIKEIGIRKVLGASVNTILMLFGREYIKLVTIAIFIALPLAWYASSQWLEDFVYRTSVNGIMLGLASVIVMLVAVGTVYVQSFRAAVSNPVKSLKSE